MPGAQLQEIEGDEYRGVVRIKVGPITAQYKGQATFVSQDAVNHVAVLRAEGRETRGQGNANATITATLVPDGDGTAVTVLTDLVVTGRVAQFGRGVLAEVSAKLLDQFVDCLEKTVLAGEATAPGSAPAAAPIPPPPGAPGAPAAKAPVGPPATVVTEAEATAPAKPARAAAAPKPAATTPAPKPAATTAAAATTTAPPAEPATPLAPAAAATPRPAIRKIDSPEATPINLLDSAGSPVAKRVGPVLAIIAVAWLLKKLFGRSK
jgi:carbon monoxide dehydrogenase subunit G